MLMSIYIQRRWLVNQFMKQYSNLCQSTNLSLAFLSAGNVFRRNFKCGKIEGMVTRILYYYHNVFKTLFLSVSSNLIAWKSSKSTTLFLEIQDKTLILIRYRFRLFIFSPPLYYSSQSTKTQLVEFCSTF